MIVIEEDADRKALVNVSVDGRIQPLEEYGEHIDPRDNAVCCYVPVEEGDKIKIRGEFSGTVSGHPITSSDTT
jgi:hypothetical protein